MEKRLTNVISRIDRRVDALLEDYLSLEENCEQLMQENESLKKEVKLREARINELKKSMLVLKKTRNANMTEENRKELNKILDEYIREIDRCIAELSRGEL